jgi:hypothetical protein
MQQKQAGPKARGCARDLAPRAAHAWMNHGRGGAMHQLRDQRMCSLHSGVTVALVSPD